MDTGIIRLAGRISSFLMRISMENTYRCPDTIPRDDFAYAHAITDWEKRGSSSSDFFSTEDPWFIEYAEQLSDRFGLEIVSREEGLKREAAISAIRKSVCEIGFYMPPFIGEA